MITADDVAKLLGITTRELMQIARARPELIAIDRAGAATWPPNAAGPLMTAARAIRPTPLRIGSMQTR